MWEVFYVKISFEEGIYILSRYMNEYGKIRGKFLKIFDLFLGKS